MKKNFPILVSLVLLTACTSAPADSVAATPEPTATPVITLEPTPSPTPAPTMAVYDEVSFDDWRDGCEFSWRVRNAGGAGVLSAKRWKKAGKDARARFLMRVKRNWTRNFASWRDAGLQNFLPFLWVKTADRRLDGAAGAGRLKSV